MRFGNARQCIHDAFASSLRSPDPSVKGGTRFNANATIAHQAEAGLIINAVLEQKPHLRAMCVYTNAPEGWATQEDIAALKSKLWRDIIAKHSEELSLTDQGRLVAMLDYVIDSFRTRVHNPTGAGIHKSPALAKILRAEEDDIERLSKLALNLLQQYDNLSLQPVWHVVNEYRDKYDQDYSKTA